MTTMTMTWILMAGLGVLLGQGRLAHSWYNSYDQPFEYACSGNKFLYKIASNHDNRNEDRLFEFSCRSLPEKGAKARSCFWSHDVNHFDHPVAYECPNNGFITGISSYHSNHYEDRRFKFRCCRSPGFVTVGCRYTDWVNHYDQSFFYAVPSDRVLKSMDSIHSNPHGDRRFKFQVCRLKKVKRTKA